MTNYEQKDKRVLLTQEEKENIKADLLSFIHIVSEGNVPEPQKDAQALSYALELIAKFF